MAYLNVDFFSEVLNKGVQMAVILPEMDEVDARLFGYKNIGVKNKDKLPVLYLLHGMTDNYTTWVRNSSIERYASEHGIAVVLPDTYLGWYTDMKAGYKYFTYFADELPQIVKKFFPCISSERKDTFIAGNSMGAYGAFKLAMLRPERYIAAGGISGGYTPSDHILNSTLGFSMDYWEDIFGDIQDIKTGNNDILALAQKLSESKEPKPELYMWCGTEDWLLYQNHQIKDGLNRLGFNLTYSESTGMHSWECWDKVIRDFLDWIPLKKGEN